MIYGNGTKAEKDMGWSNGYFVGYTYSENLKLDFKFNSNANAKATIVLRLGSELGDIILDPYKFEVQLNGDLMAYRSISVANSKIESMSFSDKVITTRARLSQGDNTISLVVRKNEFKSGGTGGPCIDCLKISTTAKLTWTDLLDNPARRED